MNGRGYGGRPHCKARLEGADSVSGTYSLYWRTVLWSQGSAIGHI